VLDTTRIPDGFHALTAVAYEGTSVRTQTGVSRNVWIQNTALAATFTAAAGRDECHPRYAPAIRCDPDATNISRIELFGTGGSMGVASNQPSAVFTIPSATLGLGLHPFYAIVTDTAGNRYQTQTDWIRLGPSLKLSISGPPLTLSWPAIPGERYDVLATTNLLSPFQTVASLVASTPHPVVNSNPAQTGELLSRELDSPRPALKLNISGPPLTLSWPAIPGQRYDVLATVNPSASFQTVTSLVASNAVIQWPISATAAAASFYRVSLSP